jgi:trimethylguanosine synthase
MWTLAPNDEVSFHLIHLAISSCHGIRTNLIVLDAFCGCGGNAIAFAARDEIALVVCVDIDRKKLEMAAHNATIYGIPKDKLLLIHDNAINILESIGKKDVQRSAETELCCGYRLNDTLPDAVDCIFLSPPWGGTDYASKNNFTLTENVQISSRPSNETINGEGLLERAATLQRRVIYFLPRNINGIPLGRSAIKAGYSNTTVELEMNMLNDKFKTVTAYFGMNAQEKVEQGEVKPEASSHQ